MVPWLSAQMALSNAPVWDTAHALVIQLPTKAMPAPEPLGLGRHRLLPCSPPGHRLKGGGGYPLPPPQHSGPDSTPKAFPSANTSPNRISNCQ